MDDLFSVLRGLEQSTSAAEARPLQRKFKKHLCNNPAEVEKQLRNIISQVIRRSINSVQPDIVTHFYEVDAFCYVKGREPRLALFIAVLQEPGVHREDFENILLKDVVDHLAKLRLRSVVDDINVNHLQWVAGKVTDHHGKEKNDE